LSSFFLVSSIILNLKQQSIFIMYYYFSCFSLCVKFLITYESLKQIIRDFVHDYDNKKTSSTFENNNNIQKSDFMINNKI